MHKLPREKAAALPGWNAGDREHSAWYMFPWDGNKPVHLFKKWKIQNCLSLRTSFFVPYSLTKEKSLICSMVLRSFVYNYINTIMLNYYFLKISSMVAAFHLSLHCEGKHYFRTNYSKNGIPCPHFFWLANDAKSFEKSQLLACNPTFTGLFSDHACCFSFITSLCFAFKTTLKVVNQAWPQSIKILKVSKPIDWGVKKIPNYFKR